MLHKFFRKKDSKTFKESALEHFFKHFPENEFWRFFVERARYDFRQGLYRVLYAKMNGASEEQAQNIPVSEIEKLVKDVTIGQVYQLAEQLGDHEALTVLNNIFHAQDRKSERVTSLFNKHQGWLGFEDNEPGYLLNVAKGFSLVVENILSDRLFTLDFIKELHKTCTSGVKNMLAQTPGEFRSIGASWQMNINTDSLEGLIETIEYLKSVEEKMGESGLVFLIQNKESKEYISNFLTEDTHLVANKIWDNLKEGAVISYISEEKNESDSSKFLHAVCSEHIQQLEDALEHAKTKQDKLTAIFTYLKHTVLHHPFQDGVGRTYSMLLSQFLLMRENFLPVLILNSNIIPGYSVKELIDEYLRAEKEMEKILEFPHYISSDEMVTPNVDTEELLSRLSAEEAAIFKGALIQFQEVKGHYLEWSKAESSWFRCEQS
ncbi:hypothetical protein DGG96_07480 [Legionella qingyii]|uniref:Fido domain-containing protein n=1 Tax=Legionella qingyii TaxID=2184757 RepID=A0A317U4J2_9GAMM|nr:Fic family protein [Legionella qingyii]PWY56175.1 hypothetical protein DGG96_07480 [Legionella qingyii]RUR22203.1 hypothetical protein ELY20_09855 [Legionella qingyii]RUR25805.1 hypothetical protein ELY16_09145 [Legionella qingyii]